MPIQVTLDHVQPRKLAAIRRRVPIEAIATAWRPALDQVWAFLRANPGLRTDGHNIFLYHHATLRTDPMDIDFGVEVAHSFTPTGEIRETETPAGEAAIAIHQWAKSSNRTFAGYSWEIYGDPSPDPSKNETTIVYLLA